MQLAAGISLAFWLAFSARLLGVEPVHPGEAVACATVLDAFEDRPELAEAWLWLYHQQGDREGIIWAMQVQGDRYLEKCQPERLIALLERIKRNLMPQDEE